MNVAVGLLSQLKMRTFKLKHACEWIAADEWSARASKIEREKETEREKKNGKKEHKNARDIGAADVNRICI